MALGEAAANAAKYGRPEEGRSEVRIRCALESGTFTVTVADDGPGFDPPPPDEVDLPERYSSGGRGLFLMRALMDDVVITSSDDGTTVTMAKHLGLAA